jgi:glycosyltransferase involved in cell wall biosynthesis
VCIFQQFMPPDASGAGKQALTLARVVRDAGWNVVLLTEGDPHTHYPPLLEGFPVVRIAPLGGEPSYPQLFAYWFRVCRAIIRMRRRFDVLHVHTTHLFQVGAIPIARVLGKRVVVRSSISGDFSGLNSSKSGWVRKMIMTLADAFVVLSERLSGEYLASGLPEADLNLIPNGVDTTLYHPVSPAEKLRLREELDLPPTKRIVIFHGVFIERKSLHWLVDVLGPRLEELNVVLLLLGGPARDEDATSYAAHLRQQIENSPHCDHIIVRQHQPSVQKFLQAADAYVLPSTGEGLPNALLEAMAVGLVPIATRTSGAEDVIVDGVSGYLFEPRDSASLMRCVDAALCEATPAALADVAAAAVERVRSNFGIRATGMQYVRIYGNLISGKTDVRPQNAVAPTVDRAAADAPPEDGSLWHPQ